MIRVHGLTFAYPGSDAPAVRDMSFEVRAGEVFGFLGPSGAGKSTTQNLLIGLLQGYQGDIEVMGRPLSQWGSDYYARVGVSFELPNHYLKLTARENLDYFRALYDGPTAEPEAVLDLVGLADVIDVRVSEFSKGMKNRLTLARSLLNRPTLWFLDEPTAGLDPVNAVAVRDLVATKQREGVTTLITTHDMHVADTLCDRVAFIVDGRVVEVDTPEALRLRFGRRELMVTHGDPSAPRTTAFPMDGLGDDPEFIALLRRDPLVAMHSQEATLEDVFVQVTGRSLT